MRAMVRRAFSSHQSDCRAGGDALRIVPIQLPVYTLGERTVASACVHQELLARHRDPVQDELGGVWLSPSKFLCDARRAAYGAAELLNVHFVDVYQASRQIFVCRIFWRWLLDPEARACRRVEAQLGAQRAELRDAETQLRLALEHMADEETVRSCINSLISAGRSVTLVMQKESSGSTDLAESYRKRMLALTESSPHSGLLRFFNEKRVHSIHRGVVAPQKLTPTISEFKVNGVLQPGGERTMIFYRFDRDIRPGGSGGVFRLCDEYLAVLRTLVSEWLAKRAEFRVS
jgi:hypothetical protein